MMESTRDDAALPTATMEEIQRMIAMSKALPYICEECSGMACMATTNDGTWHHYCDEHIPADLRELMASASDYRYEPPTNDITTVEQYATALERIDQLHGAVSGTPEGSELERLTAKVVQYEKNETAIWG